MRIAVVSDIHGNIEAMDAMWERLQDVDRVYCLGDMIGIGPDPREVLLKILDDERVRWVLGNHEVNTRDGTEIGPIGDMPRRPHHEWVRYEIGDLVNELGAPFVIHDRIDGKKIMFMHRHPDDCGSEVPYYERPFPEVLDDFYSDMDADILFFGHTHVPLMLIGGEGRLYINPGSVGAQNGGLAMGLVIDDDFAGGNMIEKVRVRFDREPGKRKLLKKKVPYNRFIIDHFYSGDGFAPFTVKDI